MGNETLPAKPSVPPEDKAPEKGNLPAVRAELDDLKDMADPMKRFEGLMTSVSGMREGIPMLKDMDQKQAAHIMMLFGLLIFMHTMDAKKDKARLQKDEAETDKFKAEADKYKAETEALRKGIPAGSANAVAALQQETTQLREELAKMKGDKKEKQPFVERKKAPKLQNAVQIASEKVLRDEGKLSEEESRQFSRGLLVFVDADGNLVVEVPESLRNKVRELNAQGKRTSLVELVESSLTPVTELGKETVFRATFNAGDTAAKAQFDRLVTALKLDTEK